MVGPGQTPKLTTPGPGGIEIERDTVAVAHERPTAGARTVVQRPQAKPSGVGSGEAEHRHPADQHRALADEDAHDASPA